MEPIASDGRRAFFLRVLAPGEAPAPPFGGDPYPALVWAARRTTPAQKRRLAAALVETGCRYVVCGGAECEAWEEAADDAYLDQDLPDPESTDRLVLTTSHPREPEDEVAFFFVHDTRFGGHDFTRFLVLLIGDDPGARERLAAAIRAEL